MTAIRVAGLVLLFGAGFLVTRQLLHGRTDTVSAAPSAPPGAGPAARPSARASSDRAAPLVRAPRIIERGTEPLTEWQEIILAEPERGARTRAMVKGELFRHMAQGNHPASCLEGSDGVIGDYRFVFETDVRSSSERVLTSPWRFVRVQDGTPISPEARACMEAMLATPFTIEAPRGANVFLASYDGALQVEVTATAEPPADADD